MGKCMADGETENNILIISALQRLWDFQAAVRAGRWRAQGRGEGVSQTEQPGQSQKGLHNRTTPQDSGDMEGEGPESPAIQGQSLF